MALPTHDDNLAELCRELAARADALDQGSHWPAEQLALCARHGLFGWFVPAEFGGQDLGEAELARGWLRLGEACLTTAFVLTQWAAACRRIVASPNEPLRRSLLPELAAGRMFVTVAISHLTTSRRHVGKPVLIAREEADELVLDGYSAWVTGAAHAQQIVVGADLADGRQVLVALPTDLPGVECQPGEKLLALSASHTGMLRLTNVRVPREYLLAGPGAEVMGGPAGAGTGGLVTSALALGLAAAAVGFLHQESAARPDLAQAAAGLEREQSDLAAALVAAAEDTPRLSAVELRAQANSLALRATQAALAAAKGAGFVAGHPAGRWAREAMFFLVWSCPQPVMAANLCELAGLG